MPFPTDNDTGACFCPECGAPEPSFNVEAFEILDIEVCHDCGVDALEAHAAEQEEADDRRRDNALEADFARMDR